MTASLPSHGGSAPTRLRYVARELAFGRETFQRLLREKGALVGWVPTTLRLFAADLAEDCLAAIGLREADDVTLADLVKFPQSRHGLSPTRAT